MGQVDKIYVEEGETVKKGKILASINSDIIQSNIEEIESSLNLLKTIYDRQSNLWKEEIGSEIEYLRSKTNYESAKNRYNALKIQASKFSITAPFSGIIESVNTKVGEVSSPGMPAFRMFNDSDSYISVDVPENYLNSFEIGDTVLVNGSDQLSFNSIIISVGQVINPSNRTFSLGINIKDDFKDDFKPNQVVGIKLTDYKNDNDYKIQAQVWTQNSAEYRALCYQAFNAARINLDALFRPYSIDKGSIPLSNLNFASVSRFNFFAVFLIEPG